MAHSSLLIIIPTKTTESVDWYHHLRDPIHQIYEENPRDFLAECRELQSCRDTAIPKNGGSLEVGLSASFSFGHICSSTQS